MMMLEVPNTNQLKAGISKLGATDVLEIEAFVSRLVQQQAVDIALARRVVATTSCVHCGAENPVRWGRSKAGTQRFRCLNCKSTFGATNNTPFFRLRNRHFWKPYLGLMGQHIALRRLRSDHGINLSIPTLHRWRHRFLAPLVANPTTPLAGIVEADEKFFRTSFKGSRGWKRGTPPQLRPARRRGVAQRQGLGKEQVPTLTAVDRSGAIHQALMPDLKHPTISKTLKPWIEPGSVLCTDGNHAYPKAAAKAKCDHIVAKKGGQNATHLSIGRIDAYHRDVENLVNRRCNGVSTRYLMNYFGWARRITQHKPFGNDLLAELLA
ncbi:MAG: IS1595 family transposase [Caulobacterales bacterium]|nr:IS1595 family transposase [Caulobacterales bacterium]